VIGSLFLLLGIVLQIAPAPPATEPMCEIRGRVTDKETGQPIARAVVRISPDSGKTRLTTRTDDEGLYRFIDLTPGAYLGSVEPAAFSATHIGTSIGPGRILLLKPGDVRSDVNVALERSRAITVRVVDEDGEPLAGLRISITSTDGGRDFNAGWLRQTDDRGRLRVFKLPPGRYIACAEPAASSNFSISGPVRHERLLRTCYPSAATSAEAEPITLRQSDIEDLEIRMRRGRTFTITGTVVDSSGAASPDAMVSFNRFERNGSSGTVIQVKNGRFTVTNVAPGGYAIQASIGGTERPEQRRDLEEAFVPVHIESSDVTDLVVTMTKAVVVAGRIRLEQPMPRVPRDPGYGPILISARLVGHQLLGSAGFRGASVGDDSVFYLDRMFGTRKLEVFNVPRGWYLKSILYEGKDIIDTPTEFKASRDPSRLEVILSNRGAVVSGRVVDEGGETARRIRVILFPANPEQWDERHVLGINVSAGGTFKLGPRRAGDYLVVAFDASTLPPNPIDRERLAQLAPDAERITLREDDERTLDLRVMRTGR
jgi:protocatechuate 3,4-dioxygenase beta subunit